MKNYGKIIGATAISAVALLGGNHAFAEDAVDDRFAGTLLKDPGGYRSKLSDNGVDLTGLYVNQFATNLSGGTSTEAIYSDMFLLGADFDLEKTPVKIPGGSFHVTFTNRNVSGIRANGSN